MCVCGCVWVCVGVWVGVGVCVWVCVGGGVCVCVCVLSVIKMGSEPKVICNEGMRNAIVKNMLFNHTVKFKTL